MATAPQTLGGQEPPSLSKFGVFCCTNCGIQQNFEQKRRCSAAELKLSGLAHWHEPDPFVMPFLKVEF